MLFGKELSVLKSSNTKLDLKLTFMHFTAFNLFDAIKFIARSPVKPCHVIAIVTATQTLVVK